MPSFTVQKSIQIKAPIEQVYAAVRDFKQWRDWSPWLIAEPEAVVTYQDSPDGYAWEGDITGSGKLHLIEEAAPHQMRCHLEFIKPWKSVCETGFSLADKGEWTEIIWKMDGSLPFFMFFMKKMMIAFIGADYERGLTLLKDHVELGHVPCQLEFPGKSSFRGGIYIGIKTRGKTSEISQLAGESMKKLKRWLADTKAELSGPPFAIYHKWNLVTGDAHFTTGLPLKTRPESVPEEFFIDEIPDLDVYPIRYTGAYRHIANAWSAGIMHGKAKKFSQSKKWHPFEVYETSPDECQTDERLVTIVNFPSN